MGSFRHYFNAITYGGLFALSMLGTSCSTPVERAEEGYKNAVENYNKEAAEGKRLEGVFLVNDTYTEAIQVPIYGGKTILNDSISKTDLRHINGSDTTDMVVIGRDDPFRAKIFQSEFLMHNAAEEALGRSAEGGDAAIQFSDSNKKGTGQINLDKGRYSIRVLNKDQLKQLEAMGVKLDAEKTYGFVESAPTKFDAYRNEGIILHQRR